MPIRTGLTPYQNWRLSKALTDAEAAAVSAIDANLGGATLTSDNVTVAGQTIATYQLKESIKSFAPDRTRGQINVTSIAHDTTVEQQGRKTWTSPVSYMLNDDTDDTRDVMYVDDSGKRLLYVEWKTGETLVGVVSIFQTTLGATDDDGNVEVTCTLRNSGGAGIVEK